MRSRAESVPESKNGFWQNIICRRDVGNNLILYLHFVMTIYAENLLFFTPFEMFLG